MRLQWWSSQTWLFLFLSVSSISSALLTAREAAPAADAKQLISDDTLVKPAASVLAKPGGDSLGTKDAPVDGKDGRPHSGPFVETSAERDRKKAKENGGDVATMKSSPKELPSGAPKDAPETNDGVMDDPNRTGPKEGTRGTEGGISEKSKESKGSTLDTSKSEKMVEPPKEIPPLPHSDQKDLNAKTQKDDMKKDKEKGTDATTASDDRKKDDKKKDATIKEPGGLEVYTCP